MRRAVYAALAAMVVFTGGYTVVYLARWEWQRSLMAGELLLVSLIVLLAVAGAHRLNRLERHIAELVERIAERSGEDVDTTTWPAAVPAARTGDPYEAPRFRWLQPDSDSYGVFIPVLLGAGIVVSGLAALVERVATALGRGTARGGGAAFGSTHGRMPASLALPANGVLAGAPDPSKPPGPGRRVRARTAALLLAAALVATLAVVELADLTQDRPDPPARSAASTLVIEADTRGFTGAATVDPLATRLWEYCRGSTRPYVERGGIAPLGEQRYAVVVQPALGEHALRRLRGCLQDAVIDHGSFRVVSIHSDDDD